MMTLKALIILLVLKVYACDRKTSGSVLTANNHILEKFDWVRQDPGNEVGIFATIIAQCHRIVNQTKDEFRINRKYMDDDFYEGLMKRCKTNQEDKPFAWTNCVSDEEGVFALVRGGVPEPKNKTITYLELEFKPFRKTDAKGEETVCVLDELYTKKAYIVVKTFSQFPSNDSFPRGIIDSVASVHQHQLDSYGEHFLDIFGDKIDKEAIYNFGHDEYYDRDPPYECLLSIGSSESPTVIQEKCDFFCPPGNDVPPEMMEQILMQAKEEAAAGGDESREDFHNEL